MAGIDSNALLVLHCNSDFSDSSQYARTPTLVNTPTIDGTTKKFGAGSGKFLSASDQYVTYPSSADFVFGTGDFTIDLQMNFITLGANQQHTIVNINKYSGVQNVILTYYTFLSVLYCYVNTTVFQFSWSPSTATWYHIAFVRTSGNVMAFINGVQIGTTQASTQNVSSNSNGVLIGGGETVNVGDTDGYIDEVRISNIARWTSNFTAPTSEYSAPGGLIPRKMMMGVG